MFENKIYGSWRRWTERRKDGRTDGRPNGRTEMEKWTHVSFMFSWFSWIKLTPFPFTPSNVHAEVDGINKLCNRQRWLKVCRLLSFLTPNLNKLPFTVYGIYIWTVCLFVRLRHKLPSDAFFSACLSVRLSVFLSVCQSVCLIVLVTYCCTPFVLFVCLVS